MPRASEPPPELVLDSLNIGVYVTDRSRRITYWGKGAEQITGWPASEVVGKRCRDDVLCHVDKDGHQLCGEEHCPMHRCMVTAKGSTVPIVVFAQKRDGRRVPLQVTVAPLHDRTGEVIGGVETFRDLTQEYADTNRARKIQQLSLQHDLPPDPRIRFNVHYIPHDMIGGDYFAAEPLGPDQYGILLADVTGHGVPAALYTMFLRSLWDTHKELLVHPAVFAGQLSDRLHHLIEEETPFAAAICGLIDLGRGELRLVGAGNPPPFVIRSDGSWEEPSVTGLPLGLFPGAEYDEVVLPINSGDCLLFFSDGAVEISAASAGYLGTAGLRRVLENVGYPAGGPVFDEIETALLVASDRIRFDDDLTLVDVRIS
jgi:PAS domain S-box-containing protein